MRLFDFSLKINGYDISRAREQLNQIQEQDSEERVLDIFNRRNAIVKYHIENNDFYRKRVLKTYHGIWETVPVMTKRDLQQPLEQRLSKNYNSRNVYINKTSGSSGDPFIFAKDKWCHALTWAQIINRFSWYGIDFNYSKQARFYGIPLDLINNRKERLKDWFLNRYRFSVFDLSDEAFEHVLKKFKRTSFDYINGYTSSIVQFAKFLNRNNIVLKQVCPSLKVCMVTSEMLFESDKKILESSFGIPIVNEYGASELDLIAFENTTGEWQLNSDTLYIEILNQDDEVLQNGQEGRIVITSLFNKAHPFIRYDIGDIGIMNESSTLIKPILKSLIGRTNDIVKLPSGKIAAGLTFYYVTKSVIEESGNIKEFVIEQIDRGNFLIKYVSEDELLDTDKNLISSEIIKYLETGLKITFKRYSVLKRSRSGKLKQFISHI